MKKIKFLTLILTLFTISLYAESEKVGPDEIIGDTNTTQQQEPIAEEAPTPTPSPSPSPSPSPTPSPSPSPSPTPSPKALFDYSCEEIKAAPAGQFNASQIKCICDKEILTEHQRNIFGLKTQASNKSLLELLKERDGLHAKLSMTDSLLDIYAQYRGFLGDNDTLLKEVTPNSSSPSLANLETIKDFIHNNSERVSRYNLVSEVMSAIGDGAALKAKPNQVEKVRYIQSKIRITCSKTTYANALTMCEGNAWESIRPEVSQSRPPATSGDFLNKLSNTIATLDDPNDLESISSLFVDNDQLRNPIGLNSFSHDLTSMIDDTLKRCRKEVLINDEMTNENCLRPSPDQAQRLMRTLEALDPDIHIDPRNATIGDITQAYLDISKKSAQLHAKATGGTIKEFMKLISDVGDLAATSRSINESLKGESAQYLKKKFQKFSKERLNNMAHHLESLGLEANEKLFARYSKTPQEKDVQSLSQKSNQLLQEILGVGGSNPFYANSDGKLSLNPQKIHLLIEQLVDKHDDIKSQQRALQKQLNATNNAISAIKGTNQYQDKNHQKDILWDDVVNTCQEVVAPADEFITTVGNKCQLNNNGTEGALTDLLKFNGEIIAYSERKSRKEVTAKLSERCEEDDFPHDKVSKRVCTIAIREHKRNVRNDVRTAYYSNPKNHNTIYSYDKNGKVIKKYTPKSNFALFLPQAAYTFNEQLPFYFVQRPQLKWQIENWRWAGKQQKTQQAYWNSIQQSWQNNSFCGHFGCYTNTTMLESASPTFGNSGFNFGMSSPSPSLL